jgi:hypothetical protein
VWLFAGKPVNPNKCDRDGTVKFSGYLRSGKFVDVDYFEAAVVNYANRTPPSPDGVPTGHCLPGSSAEFPFKFLNFQTGDGNMTVDEVKCKADFCGEFHDSSKVMAGGLVQEEWTVSGRLTITQVTHGFRMTANGSFLFAISEGGLNNGGSSTGKVTWEATGTEKTK